MLKKLSALLFEEEEEILEEAPIKKVVLPKKVEQVELKPVEEKPSLIETETAEDIEFESIEPIRSSFGISADGPNDEVSVEQKVTNKRQESLKLKKDIYDFHPVISPMFGVKEELHKDFSPKAIPEATPILPKSIINTVISPIYGDNKAKSEVKMVHVEAQASLPEPEKQTPIFESVFEEIKPTAVVQSSAKIELEKMDLEALLNTLNDEVDEPLVNLSLAPNDFEGEDAHQFSLFDDTK